MSGAATLHIIDNTFIIGKKLLIVVFFKFLLQTLTLVIIAMGFIFSAIFHVGTKEKAEQVASLDGSMLIESAPSNAYQMRWKDWFKERQFYQVQFIAILFVFRGIL